MINSIEVKDSIEYPPIWRTVRLKDIGFLQNGISQGKDYFGFGYPFVSYGNIYNDTLELEHIQGLANSSTDEQKLYSVKEGDVFFTRTSETIDEIGISATALKTIPQATFSGFVIRLRPIKRKILKEYSKYFFKAHINRQFLSREINLVTRASLSQNTLSNLPVLLPNHDIQNSIANFLDIKTNAIDKKEKLLIKKIDFYKEFRKSLINQAVTKGINKNVPIKSSNNRWITGIPKNWVVQRLKDSYNLFTGNSISDKSIFENSTDAIPYVATKDIDFYTGQITYDNGIYIPKSDKSFKRAKPNTTLICIEGANAGKKIGFTDKEIAFVNKLCAIKSKSRLNNDKYLYYFTQSNMFNSQFFALINGLIGGVSVSLIRYFDILIPPKEEQNEIVKYLDQRLSTIDKIISNIQSQINNLKELRRSLINDVVTGKINVTNE